MHDAIRYLKEVMHDKDKLNEYEHILCDTMCIMEERCPEIVNGMLVKMHKLAYGLHFDKDTAIEAVKNMKNVDGTTGEHWNYEEVEGIARSLNIKEVSDFYYLMNMLCSDYQNVLGNNNELYEKLAKAALDDPDAAEGKWIMTYLWSR